MSSNVICTYVCKMLSFCVMKSLLTFGFLVLGVCTTQLLSQTSVAGVTLDNQVQVGGETLTLNGAGARTKSGFKVYVAGLYLGEGKTTTAEVLQLAGSKRLKVVMLRDLSSEDIGSSFMAAMNRNATREEKTRYFTAINQLTSLFQTTTTLKKSDIITADYVPGDGMRIALNDDVIGDTIGDAAFYSLVLKVWLGDYAVETAVKTQLLRGPATVPTNREEIRRSGRKVTDQ